MPLQAGREPRPSSPSSAHSRCRRKECTRPRPHPGSCFPGQLVAWNYSLWISVPDTSGSRWGGPGRRDPSLTLGLPAREKKAAPTPLASGPSGPECVSLGSWAAARGQRSPSPLHSLCSTTWCWCLSTSGPPSPPLWHRRVDQPRVSKR